MKTSERKTPLKPEDQMPPLELPQSFYKYTFIDDPKQISLEHARRIFSDNELYFSSVTAFNDPFDGKFQIEWVGSERQRQQYREDVLKAHFPSLNRRERRSKVRRDKKMLDSPLFEKKYQDNVQRVVENFGICCLSRIPNSILMWAHYANAHCGFCLQFLDEPSDPFGVEIKAAGPHDNGVRIVPMQVDYSEKYPVVNRLNDSHLELAKKMYFTKAKEWKYEKEWRMVNENGPGPHQFPSRFLTGVIFGLRMKDKHKDMIREWCRNREPAMTYYEARQSEDSYSLNIVKIT